MHIYIGSDHGGFSQKADILARLNKQGRTVTDCGTYSPDATDYPDFAVAVGEAVAAEKGALGILLCRSGEGMEIAVNKIKSIRAALVWKAEVALETRRDNDANVLVLPSDFLTLEEMHAIITVFLDTPFSGEERHIRRLQKLHEIEHFSYGS